MSQKKGLCADIISAAVGATLNSLSARVVIAGIAIVPLLAKTLVTKNAGESLEKNMSPRPLVVKIIMIAINFIGFTVVKNVPRWITLPPMVQ